jgi:hypothetical protein
MVALDKANTAASVPGRKVKITSFAGQRFSAAKYSFFLLGYEFASPLARTMVSREQPPFWRFNFVFLLTLSVRGNHNYLADGARQAAQTLGTVLKLGPHVRLQLAPGSHSGAGV